MKRGDIIVNPWVSEVFDGKLNPMYATIYLGDNYSLDYKGRKHTWGDKVYKVNEEKRTPWKVIGHVNIDAFLYDAISKAVMDGKEFEEPNINPCRGCEDYDGYGGCKSNGGCGRTEMDGIKYHSGEEIKDDD